ncbi:hypothetical protein like AT2G04420 [Hibiscus trionum]|uniref:RNase H type-1 domain-containing protein n=1 Tax=Hibiscus trionum TaxID=183268 RepID=A0A9W7INP2_HIBTR|nr:hypothetical protein like AT2G04420 [Hibiscus trionum]
MDIQLVSSRSTAFEPCSYIRWSAPVDPFVKVNVDASFNNNTKSAYMGVVIRNIEGFILGACSTISYQIPSPFAAKARAIIQGLRLALDLGFIRIEVEGDSRSVITKLISESPDLYEIGALISEANGISRSCRECRF